MLKEKSYYNGSDSYFYDLITSNKDVFSNKNAVWIRHAGYRKHKGIKAILHDSLLTLKETITNLYKEKFFVSTIVKLEDYDNYSYFVYFPENNLMIKIFVEASYEDISIDFLVIKKDMNKFYSKKIFDYVFSDKVQRSEEVKKYNLDFFNSINQFF